MTSEPASRHLGPLGWTADKLTEAIAKPLK